MAQDEANKGEPNNSAETTEPEQVLETAQSEAKPPAESRLQQQAEQISALLEIDTEVSAVSIAPTFEVVSDEYSFLEQQIFRGEADTAINQLDTAINQLESTHHRYHGALIRPLTLKGDALMVQKNFDGALDNYTRARHIARTANGLFDVSQVEILYREAEAHRKINDLQTSGEREEYALEVVSRSYEPYDMRLVAPLHRLAKFYMQTHNYLAARGLYRRALSVFEANRADHSTAAIETLQGIARSHLLERFPPIYVNNAEDTRLIGPQPGLNTAELESQQLQFNNFPAGEKALQRVVDIRKNEEPPNPGGTLTAILQLADWHMMFGRTSTASTLYTHIFEEMPSIDEDPAAFFADPTLLYLPSPQDPDLPEDAFNQNVAQGQVSLQFDVTTSGRVRKLKTIASEPPRMMDFRVRRSMRLAQFRPRLVDGTPVHSEMQTYTHDFPYLPRDGEVATDTEGVDTPENPDQAPPSEAPSEAKVDKQAGTEPATADEQELIAKARSATASR